jgi:hypothetical protein
LFCTSSSLVSWGLAEGASLLFMKGMGETGLNPA